MTRRHGELAKQQRHHILRQRRALTTMLKDCKELSERCCEMLRDYSDLIDGLKDICNEDALAAAVEEQGQLATLLRDCERYYTVAIAENDGVNATTEAEDAAIDELVTLTEGLMIP